jgi:hypothetical protein
MVDRPGPSSSGDNLAVWQILRIEARLSKARATYQPLVACHESERKFSLSGV